MKILNRKEMNEEIISKVKSMPTGVDWRIIRLRRQSLDNAARKTPVLDHKTTMAAS